MPANISVMSADRNLQERAEKFLRLAVDPRKLMRLDEFIRLYGNIDLRPAATIVRWESVNPTAPNRHGNRQDSRVA